MNPALVLIMRLPECSFVGLENKAVVHQTQNCLCRSWTKTENGGVSLSLSQRYLLFVGIVT